MRTGGSLILIVRSLQLGSGLARVMNCVGPTLYLSGAPFPDEGSTIKGSGPRYTRSLTVGG